LREAERVLTNIPEIEFIYFSKKDVVRHRLVQLIVEAYEQQQQQQQSPPKNEGGE
jgi:phosphate starvation-inducible protein PhoH and related proteins